MPKLLEDDKINVRILIEGEDFRQLKELAEFYGIYSAKDLVCFLLKKEYRELKKILKS